MKIKGIHAGIHAFPYLDNAIFSPSKIKLVSDVGYLSLPDTHSTTEPELESRFYFRILLKDSKESDLKVLKVHKKLRDEAEHYLEPESKHLIGIAYFRQGKNHCDTTKWLI